MKKVGIYVLIGLVLILLVSILANQGRKGKKRMDERITLKHRDAVPYGTAAAFKMLPSLFPGAHIYHDISHPGSWDSISSYDEDQAVILVANNLDADEEELTRLLNFAKAGNTVFIIARTFSYDVNEFFHFSVFNSTDDPFADNDDSLSVGLDKTLFPGKDNYVYPGRRFASYFNQVDVEHTKVLGHDGFGRPNFIQFAAGNGKIFIHSAPLAFSNYFVLHKDNVHYYERALSVIPTGVNKILWNEYYLSSHRRNESDPGWLRVLMRQPAFKWAFLLGLASIVLYVLLASRRKQRLIPDYTRPKNDSLDFAKTLGRLYFEKGDHRNLAIKISNHFLDHVRTRYQIATTELDEGFVERLHFKSGYSKENLAVIIDFIRSLPELPAISDRQLASFHRDIELFYQNI